MSATVVFRLPDADRLDEDHVVARGLEHQHRIARLRAATPPSVVPAGLGRMKARSSTDRRAMRVLSPRMLPPLVTARGVDGEHRDAVVARRGRCPAASMKRALAHAGHAGDADAAAPPAGGHQQISLCEGDIVFGLRGLDERDRAPDERRSPARRRRRARRSTVSVTSAVRVISFEDGVAAHRSLAMTVPGPKIAAAPASRRAA